MPRYVNIPGIGEYEFPDGMSDADIYSAVDDIISKKRETTDYLDLLPDYTSAPPVEPVVPSPVPAVEPEPEPIPKEPTKEKAEFLGSLGEGYKNIFNLNKALDYGLDQNALTREAVLKEAESKLDRQSFDELKLNIDNAGSIWRWTKETAGQSVGFQIPGLAAGGVGALFAGPVGFAALYGITTLANYLTSNLVRQAQENQKRVDEGKITKEASIAKATGSAAFNTVLDMGGGLLLKPVRKLMGFEGGKVAKETADELVKLGSKSTSEEVKKTTLEKLIPSKEAAGEVTAFTAFEGLQEVAQTASERWQAGLDLTGEEANKEYTEALAGGLVLGAGISTTTRVVGNVLEQRANKKAVADPELKQGELLTEEDSEAVLYREAKEIVEYDDPEAGLGIADVAARMGIDPEVTETVKTKDKKGKTVETTQTRPRTVEETMAVMEEKVTAYEKTKQIEAETEAEAVPERGEQEIQDEINQVRTRLNEDVSLTPETRKNLEQDLSDLETDLERTQTPKEVDPAQMGFDFGTTPEIEPKTVTPEYTKDVVNVKPLVEKITKAREEGRTIELDSTKSSDKLAPNTLVLTPEEKTLLSNFPDAVQKATMELQSGVVAPQEPTKSVEQAKAELEQLQKAFETTQQTALGKLPKGKKGFTADEVADRAAKYLIEDLKIAQEGGIDAEAKNLRLRNANELGKLFNVVPAERKKLKDIVDQKVAEYMYEPVRQRYGITESSTSAQTPNVKNMMLSTPVLTNTQAKLVRSYLKDVAKAKPVPVEDRGATTSDIKALEETLDNVDNTFYTSAPFGRGVNPEWWKQKFSDVAGAVKDLPSTTRRIFFNSITPLRALADIYGDKLPALRRLANVLDRYEGNIRTYTDEAKRVVDMLGNFKAKSYDQYKILARLVYNSTYYNMNANKTLADQNLPNTDANQARKKELDKLYSDVGETGQRIYNEIDSFFTTRYNQLTSSLKKRISKLVGEEGKNNFVNEPKIKALMAFDKPGRLNFYFPLKRKGRFWVNFKLNNPDQTPVSMSFPAKGLQQQFINQLTKEQETNNQILKGSINSFVAGKIDSTKYRGTLDLNTIEDIKKIMAKSFGEISKDITIPNSLNNDLAEYYVSHSPEHSVLRGLLAKRKGTLGAAGDITDVFAENAVSMSRQVARFDNSSDMDVALSKLKEQVRAVKDKEEQAIFADLESTANSFVQNVKNPTVGFTIRGKNLNNLLGKAGFFYYLATPAAAMINLIQTPTIAASFIHSKFGWNKTYAAIMKAGWDTRAGFLGGKGRDTERVQYTYRDEFGKLKKGYERLPKGLTKDEQQAMVRAYQNGIIDRTQSTAETTGDAETVTGKEIAIDKATNPFSFVINMFSLAERFNREVTFLAAYRLAKSDPSKLKVGKVGDRARYANPYSYASDITQRSQGNYSQANSGTWFKGNAKALLMFKKYPVLMYYNYIDAWRRWGKGRSIEERQEALRLMTGMIGTGLISAGLYGLPAYGLFELIFGWAVDNLREDEYNIRGEFQTTEVVRNSVGEIMYKGPLQALLAELGLGVEFATRVGLGQLPILPPRATKGDNEMFQIIEALGGPAFAMGTNAFEALKRSKEVFSSDGDIKAHLRAIETTLPLGVRNLFKAVRFADEGPTTLKGYDLLDRQLNGFEIFMQGIGFTPQELARQYDLNNARKNLSVDVARKKTQIITGMALAVLDGDKELYDKTFKRLIAFNKAYPELNINPSGVARSINMRQRNKFLNNLYGGGGMNINPRESRFIEQELNRD